MLSGSSGALARRSRNRNPASRTTPPISANSVTGRPQPDAGPWMSP